MKKTINPDYFISLWLDIRRDAVKGLYPVKLRVFTKVPRKQKLYSTKFKLSKKDFQSAWETLKPRQEYKDLRADLQAALDHAEAVAKKLTPFSFEAFEKEVISKSDSRLDIFHQYDQTVLRLRDNKQFGTADTYELCKKSLIAFMKTKLKSEAEKLIFAEVTPDWLRKYEKYMTEDLNRSLTTVSMYIRTLRTLFNIAIDAKDIEREIYPFGRRMYQIPAARNIKKALSKEVLKKLLDATPLNYEEERAKDFFFFSYVSNGMNIKDIAELRNENLRGDTIQFIRAKTKSTSKTNQKPVVFHLTDFSKSIVDKYRNKDRRPEAFLFQLLSEEASAYENFRRVKNFTTSINHNIKKLALSVGIKENISSYTARHSFATVAILNGASMEYISEALSHSNLKTTQNYFSGFEEKEKKKITDSLMNFIDQ